MDSGAPRAVDRSYDTAARGVEFQLRVAPSPFRAELTPVLQNYRENKNPESLGGATRGGVTAEGGARGNSRNFQFTCCTLNMQIFLSSSYVKNVSS